MEEPQESWGTFIADHSRMRSGCRSPVCPAVAELHAPTHTLRLHAHASSGPRPLRFAAVLVMSPSLAAAGAAPADHAGGHGGGVGGWEQRHRQRHVKHTPLPHLGTSQLHELLRARLGEVRLQHLDDCTVHTDIMPRDQPEARLYIDQSPGPQSPSWGRDAVALPGSSEESASTMPSSA